MIASVGAHAAAFLLWSGSPLPPPSEGSAAAPDRPSRPGGALVAVRAPLPETREIPPPPRPRIAPGEPEVEVRDVSAAGPALSPRLRPVALGGGGPPATPARGSSAETGSGSRRVSPPVPRSLFPEWDPPAELRGTRVTVRVRVDAAGRPTGEVELLPATSSEAFNRRLVEKVRRMEYRPALLDGSPVAGWAEITFVF